jgi:hypothetical protein
MDLSEREAKAVGLLRPTGRTGASLFAIASVERLRPLLEHVPSGSPALVAGTALTEIWRVLEGLQRPDPRRLRELSEACWVLVEIEPAPKVPAALLEALVAATHHVLETYLSGNPEQAVAAAKKTREVAGALASEEESRQDRDLREIAGSVGTGSVFAGLAKTVRERAQGEGARLVQALLRGG